MLKVSCRDLWEKSDKKVWTCMWFSDKLNNSGKWCNPGYQYAVTLTSLQIWDQNREEHKFKGSPVFELHWGFLWILSKILVKILLDTCQELIHKDLLRRFKIPPRVLKDLDKDPKKSYHRSSKIFSGQASCKI